MAYLGIDESDTLFYNRATLSFLIDLCSRSHAIQLYGTVWNGATLAAPDDDFSNSFDDKAIHCTIGRTSSFVKLISGKRLYGSLPASACFVFTQEEQLKQLLDNYVWATGHVHFSQGIACGRVATFDPNQLVNTIL